jgi:hypothetical protein
MDVRLDRRFEFGRALQNIWRDGDGLDLHAKHLKRSCCVQTAHRA